MTPELNITKKIIVFATLILTLSSCFYDVRENLEIKSIGISDLNDLVKDLNLNSFNTIKDTVEIPITAWFGVPDDYLELEHFENLKNRYKVMSVPCMVIKDDKVLFGKKNVTQLLTEMLG